MNWSSRKLLAIPLLLVTLHAQLALQTLPGSASRIAASANSIYSIASTAAPDSPIYKWTGTAWTQMPGAAARIAVEGSTGIPWVVNSAGEIYRFATTNWERKPGAASDIAANGNQVAVVGGAGLIYTWNGTTWNPWAMQDTAGTTVRAARVAIETTGRAWIVSNTGAVLHSTGPTAKWEAVPAPMSAVASLPGSPPPSPGTMREIAIGGNNAVWGIDSNSAARSWTGSTWNVNYPPAWVAVALNAAGNAILVSSAGQIKVQSKPVATCNTGVCYCDGIWCYSLN